MISPFNMHWAPRFSRLLSSVSSTTYPYSSNATVLSPTIDKPTLALLQGRGLMAHLYKALPSPQTRQKLATLFSRHHPDRLLPGSVISVTSSHAPTSFTGVLLAIRRKGIATSFILRNVIQRTGVEMRFYVNSPHLTDIRVVQRAGGGAGREGKRMRKAKLFYLRDSPEKMTQISAGMKG